MQKAFIKILIFLILLAIPKCFISAKDTHIHVNTSFRNSFVDESFAMLLGLSTEYEFEINQKRWGFGIGGNYVLADVNEADLGLKLYYRGFQNLIFTARPMFKLKFYDTYDTPPSYDFASDLPPNGIQSYFGADFNIGFVFELNKMELIPIMGIEYYTDNIGLLFGVNWKF
jgi:hypothetical protein